MNPSLSSAQVDPSFSERMGLAVRSHRPTGPRVLNLGMDWGTGCSRLLGSRENEDSIDFRLTSPTCVGYAKDGIVENLLPGNARVVFGKEAIRHRLHLQRVQPIRQGRVAEPKAAHEFAQFLRAQLGADDADELRVVVGIPSACSASDRQAFRHALTGVFDAVLLVPKPFLAALGYRDESQLQDSDYVDPASNSIFVDLGAGTTDVCLVQGAYPAADEQVSIELAGDELDQRLSDRIRQSYPESNISLLKVRELKEQFAYVGEAKQPAIAELCIQGKLTKVDLTQMMGECCRELLQQVFAAIVQLVSKADSESVPELIQHIFLTGGGSRIRSIDWELTKLLWDAGLEGAQVRVADENDEGWIALGALKASRRARLDQWQRLSSEVE